MRQNTLIIGGTSGFGNRIANRLIDTNVLSTGRSLCLEEGEWVTRLQNSVVKAFGSTDNINHVIVAAYDRLNVQTNIQLNTVRRLYEILKDKPVVLSVIGDFNCHFARLESMYKCNKFDLWSNVMKWHDDPERKCGVLFYEPKTVDASSKSTEEFCDVLGMTDAPDFTMISSFTKA